MSPPPAFLQDLSRNSPAFSRFPPDYSRAFSGVSRIVIPGTVRSVLGLCLQFLPRLWLFGVRVRVRVRARVRLRGCEMHCC